MSMTDNEMPLTAQEITEYAVWYARKQRGTAADVAARLLEEFPYLREPLEAAARSQPATEGLALLHELVEQDYAEPDDEWTEPQLL